MTVDNEEIKKEIMRLGGDIIQSDRFKKAWDVDHHVDYNVAAHSLEAAGYALKIAKWFSARGVKVNKREVVRATLLHDIGMTEDRVHRSPSYRKAYLHPKEGYRIAEEEYSANRTELEAIRRHMWPVCLIPPVHLTGWIVLMADKASASREAKETAKHRAENKIKKHTGKKRGEDNEQREDSRR